MKNIIILFCLLSFSIINLKNSFAFNTSSFPDCKPYDTSKKSDSEKVSNWNECWGSITLEDDAFYGDSVEGVWKKGKLNGKGTYRYSFGDVYTGEFLDGRKHGNGIYKFENGTQYIGEFKNGKQEGIGKLIRYDGRITEGKWEKGNIIKVIKEISSNNIDVSYEESVCAQIGFQKGTESYGNCVLRLLEKNRNSTNRQPTLENNYECQRSIERSERALAETRRIQDQMERERQAERKLKAEEDQRRRDFQFFKDNERAMCQSLGNKYCN